MAVGAVLIFPSIAPVRAGANDGKRRVGNGGFTAGGFKQEAAIIPGAQSAQAELGGREVIDAGRQVGQVAANQIKLDLVERSGTGGSAKVDLAARIIPLSRDAGGEVEELRHRLQVRRRVRLGGDALGDGR